MAYWTAARTKQHQESRAAHHIERQDFPFYLPRMLSGSKSVLMFPGWIFIQIDPRWRCLLGTRGVSRLIVNNESPVRIPDREINSLKGLEDEDGRIVLPPRFSSGDRVEIVSGVFADRLAAVESCSLSRCMVLIDMLGRLVRVPIEPALLKLA